MLHGAQDAAWAARRLITVVNTEGDPELERAQVERLRALRARRDAAACQAALQRLDEAARSERNLMPALVEAVLAWATVGEIAGRLREVFGEHRENLVL